MRVAERLRRRPGVELHPTLFNTPLIYGPEHGRDAMAAIYRECLDRLIGIQANGSSRDVTALDGSSATLADPVANWAGAMLELHERHAVPILGCCCGTALPHLEALARGAPAIAQAGGTTTLTCRAGQQ